MSIFAPQAYTKETLSKAFEWLQHQPASVRQAAANPDMLVSIYLQAQRQGIQRIDADAPVSSRKFIDDLKTLSKDFAQFDDASPVAQVASSAKQVLQNTPVTPQVPRTPEIALPPLAQMPPQPAVANIARAQTNSDGFFTLDEKSLSVVRRLQERFNLSSPEEALRMIVAVGIEQISRWN